MGSESLARLLGVGVGKGDPDCAVVGKAAQQVLGGAVGHDAALRNYDGAGANGFHFFEDVGRDDDGLVGGHFADEFADVCF